MRLKKSIIITLFLCLLMIGSVSAASDNDTAVSSDDSTSQEDNNNEISPIYNVKTTNNNNFEDSNDITDNNKLKSVKTSKTTNTNHDANFTKLAEDINTAGTELKLTKNYIYSDSESKYKDGITINKAIIIDGNGCIINGNNQSRVFNILANNIILRNITFINCLTQDNSHYGGTVISCEGDNCSIINCIFINNNAKLGAIDWKGNKGILSNCSFINCSSKDNSVGTIWWESDNGLISNCNFINCSAYMEVGTIFWLGVNGTIFNCNFMNCNAGSSGGVIDWEGDEGKLINSQFINCSAILGGAISWLAKKGTITKCSFTNCSAAAGFAIYWSGEDGVVSDTTFINNFAKEYERTGGTVILTSNCSLLNCSFINCSADYGAAIYWSNYGDHNTNGTIVNCSFTNCLAMTGGAIYYNHEDGFINSPIINCNFTKCKDSLNNALHSTKYEFTLNNCNFKDCNISNVIEHVPFDNFKELSDKIEYKNNLILKQNYTFYSEYDSAYVNGINITYKMTIDGNRFTINGKNQARVFNIKADNVILKNIIFVNCSADYGATIYWTCNTGALINCSFINCSSDYGAAIYWSNNKPTLTNCNFINCSKNKSNINCDVTSFTTIENVKINYNINSGATGILNVYLNNTFIKNVTVGDIINLGNLVDGSYVVKVVYNGDGCFERCENTAQFEVIKQDTDSSYEILPTKYDLRDYGYVTSVKNQGTGGYCWAFTALSVLESCILKSTGITYDFSENNLINYIKYSEYGLNESYDGGNIAKALAYLLSWFGPVNDTDDPYNSNYRTYIQLNSQIQIQNVLFINLDNNLNLKPIKEAIMKYGAVGISISWNSYHDYLNGSSYYNYHDTSTNHDITIVGWDDNYSKYNFYKTPKGDGAWIIKNSHGTDVGDNGYFYVSYYDTSISYIDQNIGPYTFIFNDTTTYDKNYQYDYAGATSYSTTYSNQLWIKNVYNASENEYLNAVSTYFLQELDYELEIYVNGEKQYTQSSKTKPGYYTIKLDQMIPLKTNDQFSVVYKLKTTDNNVIKIPTCKSYYLKKDYLKSNISFKSTNNKNWKDTYVTDGFCNCIKAFTILNPINTEIKLDITNRTANTIDLIATVHDQYGLLVNSGNVTFNIGDSSQVINIKNGVAKLTNIIFNKGTINAEFKSIGYNTAIISKLISNPLVDTKMNLIVTSEHNPTNIIAYITDLKNKPVKSGFVTFTTDNAIYTTDVIEGFANLTNIILNIGENHISAKYQELFYYKSSTNTTSINISLIKSKIEIITNSEENLYEIIAKVSDLENNPINIGHITFNFPNNTITLNVTNGIAKITHLFNKIGINNISIHYNNNLIYDSSDMNKIIDVPKKEVKLNLKIETDKSEVIITTNIPDCIMEYDIYININGEKYGPIHSTRGSTTFNLKNRNDGYYKYSISLNSPIYKTNNLTGEFIIKTIKTKIIAQDTTIYKNNAYSVILKDKYDVPLPNKWIYLRIDNKHYTTKTNEQGIAIFPLNIYAKTYIAYIEFLGDNDYLKSNSTVQITIQNNNPTMNQNKKATKNSAKIFAKEKTFKVKIKIKKYTITLKNKNKPIKKATVKLTVKGKKYTVRTNNKGKATFKIKNLKKKGKYTATITYKGIKKTVKIIIK